MSYGLKRAVRRKLRLGRLSIPVWSIGLAVAVAGLAAGQAVGPVLNGSVTGSTGLTVSQAIVLDVDMPLTTNPSTYGADDAVTTRNDEGTEFTVSMELNVGERVYACLYLQNESDADASAYLEMAVPIGIDVEVEEFSSSLADAVPCRPRMRDDNLVSEGQMGPGTWLMAVSALSGLDENDGIQITIEPKDDISPGFYSISGRIIQSGG